MSLEIKPYKAPEYKFKQSNYKQVGTLPTRAILLGPSGSGKGVLLSNMILEIYKDCFEKIFIWSPSIVIDKTWDSVKKYMRNELNQDNKSEKCFFDEYIESELEEVIDIQYKIIEYMKDNKMKNLFQILIIIDDFAEDKSFMRNSKLLHSLFTRGRHLGISTIVSTQVLKLLSPIIRKNVTDLYVFRLRNYSDYESLSEELSALLDKKSFNEMYNKAISQPYGFLYINLMSKDINNMFYASLRYILIPGRVLN